MPKISTIIPAYNAAAVLGIAIDSALLQDVDQQIIVVDDGSKDNTADVAAAYGSAIQIVRQSNGGVSAARNRGIAEAQGEFVAFLDADDSWLPGKLAKQLDLFEADAELGTVICDELQFTADGNIVRPSFLATRRFHSDLPRSPTRLRKPLTWLTREPFFPTSSVVTRRAVLLRVGGFDPTLSICEDRDLWLRLALLAPVGLVPEVLVRYLTGQPGSLSAVVNSARWAESLFLVLSRHRTAIEKAIRDEGENPARLLGTVYGELAETLWYADQMRSAANAYKVAVSYGVYRFLPKWLAAKTGTQTLIRNLAQLFNRHAPHR